MKKRIFLVLLAVFFIPSLLKAQDKKFHAVFIYNFYKQMQWPASYENQDFVIAVIGDSPLIETLGKVTATKTAGTSNKFIIKKVNSLDEVALCHIIFIPLEKSNLLPNVIAKFGSKPTLIITEKPGLGGQGSGINFVQVNDRLKFELNQASLKKANIKVASSLLTLAIII